MVSEAHDIASIVSPYRPILFYSGGLTGTAVHAIRFKDASSVKAELVNALRGSYDFVIALRASVDQELFVFLMHALMSPKYLNADNEPVILVDGDFPKAEIVSLQQKLSKQGFHQVKFWPLANSKNALVVNEEAVLSMDWAKQNLLSSFAAMNGFVVFDFNDPEVAANAHSKLASFCHKYFDSNPELANAFEEYRSVKSRYEILKARSGQLQQQLASSEKTVGVIRTKYKDDYENLFKWYHNEYEVLPLWYKRFGHILKVILGKRSFRSLFSDDVKKYKD
ncbi:MAG: hypothetical protein ABW036_09215 [Flavitalea sp.]